MTAKADKAQLDLVSELENRAGGWKKVAVETGVMSSTLTQYHARVMTELEAIKEIVRVIQATPLEIVATHERQLPPTQQLDSGTREGTPTMMSAMQAPSISPAREIFHNNNDNNLLRITRQVMIKPTLTKACLVGTREARRHQSIGGCRLTTATSTPNASVSVLVNFRLARFCGCGCERVGTCVGGCAQ